LVGLLLFYAGGFPDESAPLVRLAQELKRGEWLDGVALKAQNLCDRLKRAPFGVGHDEVDAAAYVGQAFEVDERALRPDVLGLALHDDVLARTLVVPLRAHVYVNHVARACARSEERRVGKESRAGGWAHTNLDHA